MRRKVQDISDGCEEERNGSGLLRSGMDPIRICRSAAEMLFAESRLSDHFATQYFPLVTSGVPSRGGTLAIV